METSHIPFLIVPIGSVVFYFIHRGKAIIQLNLYCSANPVVLGFIRDFRGILDPESDIISQIHNAGFSDKSGNKKLILQNETVLICRREKRSKHARISGEKRLIAGERCTLVYSQWFLS